MTNMDLNKININYDIKAKIVAILDDDPTIKDYYGKLDNNPKKREELGQFYTPAKVCVKMLEKFTVESFGNKDILDPCCGSGNLLIAMLIAGADSQRIYGNDYDNDAVELCRERLNIVIDKLNKENWLGINNRPYIRSWQIHQGNALHEFALKEFRPDYNELYFGDSNEEDWNKLTPQQKGARTKKLNTPKYNAYIEKAYKNKNKDAAELKEIELLKSGNLEELNVSSNEANIKSKQEATEAFKKASENAERVSLF